MRECPGFNLTDNSCWHPRAVPQQSPVAPPLFGDLADLRRDHTRRHLLIDIIVITICAVLGGADDFEVVAEFGVAKASWLRTFLTLPNVIPAHDTFWRVFRALDPVAFERCFRAWVAAVIELHPGQVIAVDGRTLRRAHNRCVGQGPLHLVSAWATANEVVLGQLRVDEKTNEIVAVPELIEQLMWPVVWSRPMR